MSPGPADQVNAKELAARAAIVERRLVLAQLERVREAGGLPGTSVAAELRFGNFGGRTTVETRVEGTAVLSCQRCLQPCETEIDEAARLMVVPGVDEDIAGGYEPFVGTPELLSLTALIEEQVLLALPLVPMHEAGDAQCRTMDDEATRAPTQAATGPQPGPQPPAHETQTPFANLRELLGKSDEH